jgi:predicted DsbA family dithiol-disulfide isomerase
MLDHLRHTAEQLGLPLGARTRTYNSRLAQELGLWAEDQGKGQEFHRAAFKAYFADGKNLAKLPVLLEISCQAGLAEESAKEVVENRTYREKVDTDWDYSRFHGITAVPTFLMGRHRLVGAQNYEALAQLVTLYGAVGRKQAEHPP